MTEHLEMTTAITGARRAPRAFRPLVTFAVLLVLPLLPLTWPSPAHAVGVSCDSPDGDSFGWSVATGADFDGDGIDDIAVGAPCARAAGGERQAGRVFVYSGASGKKLLSLIGSMERERFGGAVSFIDDVSGDGLPDLIVGSPGFDVVKPSGAIRENSGRVQVFTRTGAVHFEVDGRYQIGSFGEAVAGLADLTGDGVPDLAVGASQDRPAPQMDRVGAVYLLSGVDGAVMDVNLGDTRADEWGSTVVAAGDVDGDGVDDVMVGSSVADRVVPNSTTTTTMPGDPYFNPNENTGVAKILSGASFATVLTTVNGDNIDDKLGRSLAPAGFMDGDALIDLFVGVPGKTRGTIGKAGVVSVYSATGAKLATFAEPAPQVGAAFGTSLAAVGLVNGDSKVDFVAAAPTADEGGLKGNGRAHLMSGSDGSVIWTASGEVSGARMGQSLAGGQDWDGDGKPDVVLGVPGDTARGRRGAGTVRIVSGASGSQIRQLNGRRGLETRIFVAGWGFDRRPRVRSYRPPGRAGELDTTTLRGVQRGQLSLAVLDSYADSNPPKMTVVVAGGHGAEDASVELVSAGRKRFIVSRFTGMAPPYAGGVTVATGKLGDTGEDFIAVAQADSDDGNVEVAIYQRFDTTMDRETWLEVSRFAAFQATDVFPVGGKDLINAGGANVAVLPGGASGDEIVVAPAAGLPVVRVYTTDGQLQAEWLAYAPGAVDGVHVAVGDVGGGGNAEIVTAPASGSPNVRVFNADGSGFLPSAGADAVSFLAYQQGFLGGVRVAVADVDFDGQGEIVVGPGAGRPGEEIRVFAVDGTQIAGWKRRKPFGPGSDLGVALATTDKFLRHR